MKYLSQFVNFDWARFSKGKTFVVTRVAPWTDRDTGKLQGSRVECVIMADNTVYARRNDDEGSNRFEKITFKVQKNYTGSVENVVIPVNAVAKVYGDYNNLLSVVCDDLTVAKPQQ